MKYLSTFFLLVLIPLVAAYDYLTFVEMWHPTVCGIFRCYVYPAQPIFTIHGLWPSNYYGYHPRSCTGVQPLDLTQLKNAYGADLLNKWPSLYGFSDDDFWKHEWDVHGTCFIQFMGTGTAIDYFHYALTIKNGFDVKATLETAGVIPTDSSPYNTTDILNILSEANGGFDMELYCDGSGYYIQEVRSCLTPDANAILDCPTPRGNCEDEVNFPLT